MTLVALVVATVASAQVYVGGSVGFIGSSHDGTTKNNFQILPELGFKLEDNIAVGIVLGYAQDEVSVEKTVAGSTVTVSQKDKQFRISPYLRYTALKFKCVDVFVDAGLDYIHSDNGSVKNNTFGLGVRPGVAVNLNDKLSFVTHFGWLGYQNSKDDYDGAKATNTYGVALDGNNLTFGLYYHF